jgi:preprotein translocase subunit SecA
MILSLAKRAFSAGRTRRLARYTRTAEAIIRLAPRYRALSEAALADEAQQLRARVRSGTLLSDLTMPAFAMAREAARRALGEDPVAAQLVCGLALHDGLLVEMKTGEGKTLAATLAAFLNALGGHGVHIAVPNDHLAERDAAWMRPVYAALGVSVGTITSALDDEARRTAYRADITYGTASEFGFDYLRDNMKFDAADTVQRGLAFALVDEADAVMIDEARVPLSLFGPLGDHSTLYTSVDRIVATLGSRDYDCEPDKRRVSLSTTGAETVEAALRRAGLLKPHAGLFDVGSVSVLHHVTQALRARVLLKRDRDYVVHDGAIIIVDGLTGRLMPGRRYDDGLHQALEAKENQPIGEESRILASITFQTFLRAYDKLAGMTGTAIQDAREYRTIYDLDTLAVPPHRPVIRIDETEHHASQVAKIDAILGLIEEAKQRQQPVLIGTPSIERSEAFAAVLTRHGWRQHDFDTPLPRDPDGAVAGRTFTVLNARYHAREAEIIALAGLPGAVTIATAMAGRGTDIRLGAGDPTLQQRALAAGGLLVLGTEPHDHARLDAQLRGRAGRQGDPGRSIIHAAPDDAVLQTTNERPNTRTPPLAERIATAQARHAVASLEQRLSLARFDQVIDLQRRVIYDRRLSVRDDGDPLALVDRLREDTIDDLMATFARPGSTCDAAGLDASIRAILTLAIPVPADPDRAALRAEISATARQWMDGKVAAIGRQAIGEVLRRIMLALIDQLWAEQSERLDHLKRAIGDRRLPAHKVLSEFRIEAFAAFELMLRDYRHEVTAHAMRLGFSDAQRPAPAHAAAGA